MRIGSGVQSASEVFGKQQNNSKTYVAENEAFSLRESLIYPENHAFSLQKSPM